MCLYAKKREVRVCVCEWVCECVCVCVRVCDCVSVWKREGGKRELVHVLMGLGLPSTTFSRHMHVCTGMCVYWKGCDGRARGVMIYSSLCLGRADLISGTDVQLCDHLKHWTAMICKEKRSYHRCSQESCTTNNNSTNAAIFEPYHDKRSYHRCSQESCTTSNYSANAAIFERVQRQEILPQTQPRIDHDQ